MSSDLMHYNSHNYLLVWHAPRIANIENSLFNMH